MEISISQTHPYWIRHRPIEQLFISISRTFPQYASGSVSIVFVSDREIARLNTQYRGMRGPTDVLSFAERETISFVRDAGLIGEIVIGVPYARRQARAQGMSITDEVRRLLTHGFLHLIGYDHQTIHQARRMQLIEQRILLAHNSKNIP